jgi:hypothetical protein
MIDEKQMQCVEYFNHLRSLVSDARCTRAIKPKFVMAKMELNNKNSFRRQIGLRFKEETIEMLHFGASLCIISKLGHFGK